MDIRVFTDGFAMLVVLVFAVIFIKGYFLWFANSYCAAKQKSVNKDIERILADRGWTRDDVDRSWRFARL